MIYKFIRQAILKNPGALPLGFFEKRGAMGRFSYTCFLVAVAIKRGAMFCDQRHAEKARSKGFETHWARGLGRYWAKTGGFVVGAIGLAFWVKTSQRKRGFDGVIGNKYAKTCLFGMPSLVTSSQKQGGKLCRHW